jgi:Holliday junction resolvasome RuvABC endonuclease subunit
MITLGIDQSYTGTGWSIYDSSLDATDKCVEYGTIKTSSRTVQHRRIRQIRSELQVVLDKYPEANVGVEHPIFGASASSELYGLYLGVLDLCDKNNRDTCVFAVSTVKSYAKELANTSRGHEVFGRGWKMQKKEMVESALLHRGWRGGSDKASYGRMNDNEADAYIISALANKWWFFYEDVEGIMPKLSPVEQRSFYKVTEKRNGKVEKSGLYFSKGAKALFHKWSNNGN